LPIADSLARAPVGSSFSTRNRLDPSRSSQGATPFAIESYDRGIRRALWSRHPCADGRFARDVAPWRCRRIRPPSTTMHMFPPESP